MSKMPENAKTYSEDGIVYFFHVPDGVSLRVYEVNEWEEGVPESWEEVGSLFIRDGACASVDMDIHFCCQHHIERFCRFLRWACREVPE